MNKWPYVVNSAGGSWAREAKRAEERRKFEGSIESRSRNIANLVAALSGSLFPVFPNDGDPTDEILETLLVKEAKLRWLIRVAKYSNGVNRDALWREAENELVHLEHDAEALMHFECA